ncbi:MAG: diacylglycerol kinase [Draconibacterium sp.]|nr:MAG: diacylglycerol kinase [Draconibacterium sp.]
MKKKHILFIVNPISGGKSKTGLRNLINKYLDANIYDFEVIEAQYPKHAKEIVQANSQADIIVAVGGDGTINEVAQEVYKTDKLMGIVPMGSGNGLARHLSIPLKPEQAIQALNTAIPHKIDTATLNDCFFVSVAGVGFDSEVAKGFDQSKGRGLWNYFRVGTQSFFTYKEQDYTLQVDGKKIKRSAFMITIANSNQFGYNTKISPLASVKDGLLDVCILKKPEVWHTPVLAYKFFKSKAHTSSFLEIINAKHVIIAPNPSEHANVDGEIMRVGKTVEVKIQEKKLNILLPKK